jgi:hypothetical protein
MCGKYVAPRVFVHSSLQLLTRTISWVTCNIVCSCVMFTLLMSKFNWKCFDTRAVKSILNLLKILSVFFNLLHRDRDFNRRCAGRRMFQTPACRTLPYTRLIIFSFQENKILLPVFFICFSILYYCQPGGPDFRIVSIVSVWGMWLFTCKAP